MGRFSYLLKIVPHDTNIRHYLTRHQVAVLTEYMQRAEDSCLGACVNFAKAWDKVYTPNTDPVLLTMQETKVGWQISCASSSGVCTLLFFATGTADNMYVWFASPSSQSVLSS